MSGLAPQPLFWRPGSPSAAAKPGKASTLRLAARYAAVAGRSDDLPALQQEACHVAAEGLQADFAKLLGYDAERQDFLMLAGVGWRPGVIGRSRLEADAGTAAGFAWRTGEPVIANALGRDGRFRTPTLLVEHGLGRSINVAVPGEGQGAFGVLQAGSAKRGQFTTHDACFLQLLAHSLAAARGRLLRQASFDEQAARSADEHRTSLHEMQHRMRNDLQGICSGIDRELRGLDETQQRVGYHRISRRVLALAGLYDHLLGIQPSGTVAMDSYLAALCARIAAAADLASRGITLDAETQPVGMSIDRAGRLAVAINELVANAAEHAFPDGRAGRIIVRLFMGFMESAGARVPVVTVSDDGCGFHGPRPGSAGLGFVDRLVRGAGGVLTRSDGLGTEWRITLPA